MEISQGIRAQAIPLDIVQARHRVELGNSRPAIRSLAERAAVHLVEHSRDRFVLDQVPEAKAGITTALCWSFTYTTICRSHKSDIAERRALR